jgi:ubiquinone biosynthesis protein
MIIKEILEDGFFHADPHPGNFVVMPGEVIGAMDFGKVGYLDAGDRANLVRLYIAAVRMNVAGAVEQLMQMDVAGHDINAAHLERDLRRMLRKYHGLPLKDIHVRELVEEAMSIAFRHHLHFPSDQWLLVNTLAMMEGLGLKLAPDFDIFAVSEPYVRRFKQRLWLPSGWGPSVLHSAADWVDLFIRFPGRTTRLLNQAERGELGIKVRLPDLPQTTQSLNRIANRLSVSILISAFIIALAWVIPTLDLHWPWGLMTWAVVLGFTIMVLLGLWLLWNIWRSGR